MSTLASCCGYGQDRGISLSLPRSLVAFFCRRSFPACTVSGEQGERSSPVCGSDWGLGRERAGCRLSAQECGAQ